MDIKVNQVSQPMPVEQTQNTQPTDGTFKFMLASHIEEAELQARLQNLMEEITMEGEKLAKRRDVKDMRHYRGLVKEFLNNLIGAAVGFDPHVIIDLRTDVVDTDGIRLFMRHMNNIGMVVRQRLFAGMTFLTRLRPLLFTLQRHSKDPRNELLAGGFLTIDDVRMGNLSRSDRILQVFLHLLLSYNVPKVSHTPSFLCTFHTNPM